MKKSFFIEFCKDIFLAGCMAVLFTPVIFLSDIISNKFSSIGILWLSFIFLYLVVITALYGLAFLSESKLHSYIRLGLSIPFSYLCLTYFWNTDYSIRSLYWIYPQYEKPGPGNGLLLLLILVLLSMICIAEIVLCVEYRQQLCQKFRKLQFPLCAAAAVIVILIVVLLEKRFPPMSSIPI